MTHDTTQTHHGDRQLFTQGSHSQSFNHGGKNSLRATCPAAYYFSEGKLYTSFASKPDRRQLTSAIGIPAAPTTSPSASQRIPPPTTEADDQKVSYMIHDPLSCSDGD